MENSLEVLSDIILSLKDHSSDRARLLVGSYGKGKSHLVFSFAGVTLFKGSKHLSKFTAKVESLQHRSIRCNHAAYWAKKAVFAGCYYRN